MTNENENKTVIDNKGSASTMTTTTPMTMKTTETLKTKSGSKRKRPRQPHDDKKVAKNKQLAEHAAIRRARFVGEDVVIYGSYGMTTETKIRELKYETKTADKFKLPTSLVLEIGDTVKWFRGVFRLDGICKTDRVSFEKIDPAVLKRHEEAYAHHCMHT